MDGNLWRRTAGPPLALAPLSRDVRADVVVIGGGYSGCSAALHLAESGADVVLLEAETVGHGGSGRNVGLVNAGLWTPPDSVEAILGRDAGLRLNAALADGPALVFDLIDRHGIDCEALRNGTLHCAHSARGLADLRNRHRQAKARGAPVDLLDALETARRTGAAGLHGALLDRRAGTVQPLAYARGLARAAISAGAHLHEGSRVVSWQHGEGAWRVRTAAGAVTAPAMIVATNAYDGGAPEGGRGGFTPLYYFQCATAPLDSDYLADVLPARHGCWDTAPVMTSFRLDAAGRLIVGSIGALGPAFGEAPDGGTGASTHLGWARRRLAKLFPALGGRGGDGLALETAWYGRIALTVDHLPRIERVGPPGARALRLYGYSGRGIAPGTVFGRAAAKWARTGDESALPVVPTAARRDTLAALRCRTYGVGAALTHLVGARSARRR